MSKKSTTEEFIRRAKEVHGDKYDYSESVYEANNKKLTIICKEHGRFEQTPYKHIIGQGCPHCSRTKKGTTKSFIEKATKVHNGVYDYSEVNYVNNDTVVKIICKEHGVFEQTPHSHLKGSGCPLCGLKKTRPNISYDEFIKRSIEKHGDKYIYPSEDKYVNIQVKIPIICKEHGEFWQRPYMHTIGNGCPICAANENGKNKRLSNEEFIKKAVAVHGQKYDYSQTVYITAKNKIKIICPTHGEFWQAPYHHLQGCGCPQCKHYTSKSEEQIYKFICDKIGAENVVSGDRSVLNGKELDIYIPSLNTAIEFNGLYWHNEHIVDKRYHLLKTDGCKAKGVKLLQIFEDEFIQKPEIVYNKIDHILGFQNKLPRIMGRKCKIQPIDKNTARTFLNEYHIQGFSPSTVYLGAVFNDELIGVMSFKQEEKGSEKWELSRFASNYHYICQGLGGKLFKHFVKEYNPSEVKSFADRRWTVDEENNIYKQLGFEFDKYTNVEYRYYNPKAEGCARIHKFNCRIHILNKKFGLPLTMTEREMTTALGYVRIYDCGLIKYVWKNTNQF